MWLMFAGFLLWEVWKELNSRIFQDTKLNTQHVWSKVESHVQEMIETKKWIKKDWETRDLEKGIHVGWGVSKVDHGWTQLKTKNHDRILLAHL